MQVVPPQQTGLDAFTAAFMKGMEMGQNFQKMKLLREESEREKEKLGLLKETGKRETAKEKRERFESAVRYGTPLPEEDLREQQQGPGVTQKATRTPIFSTPPPTPMIPQSISDMLPLGQYGQTQQNIQEQVPPSVPFKQQFTPEIIGYNKQSYFRPGETLQDVQKRIMQTGAEQQNAVSPLKSFQSDQLQMRLKIMNDLETGARTWEQIPMWEKLGANLLAKPGSQADIFTEIQNELNKLNTGGKTPNSSTKDKFGFTVGEEQKGHKYIGNNQWQKI